MDFSETVAACDFKACRCSQLSELMNLQEYLRLRVLDYISVYTQVSGSGPLVLWLSAC